MTIIKELCTQQTIDRDITICYLAIPEFVSHIFREFPYEDYSTQKPIRIDASLLTENLYNDEELEKINSFKTLKKQVEWMSGRCVIKHLVQTMVNRELAYPAIRLAYREYGAPYLVAYPELTITITHSHHYAMGGISLNNKRVIGLDAEKIEQKGLEHIKKVAFSERELEHLDSAPPHEMYRYWTIKEAYVKYIERGFNESLKKIEIIDNTIYHNRQEVPLRIQTDYLGPDYIYSLVYDA